MTPTPALTALLIFFAWLFTFACVAALCASRRVHQAHVDCAALQAAVLRRDEGRALMFTEGEGK